MLMFSVLEPLKIQFIQYMVLKQTIFVVCIEFRFEWFDILLVRLKFRQIIQRIATKQITISVEM